MYTLLLLFLFLNKNPYLGHRYLIKIYKNVYKYTKELKKNQYQELFTSFCTISSITPIFMIKRLPIYNVFFIKINVAK